MIDFIVNIKLNYKFVIRKYCSLIEAILIVVTESEPDCSRKKISEQQ